MGIVVFSELSRNDIFDIWAQIATQNRTAADALFDRLEARCGQLVDFPELGPHRRDISDNSRVLVFERWLIVYETIEDGVLIVRIIDGARDLSNLLTSNE